MGISQKIGITASEAIRLIATNDPTRIAVETEAGSLSYADLTLRADQLAFRLAAGAPTGSRIVLRGYDMIELCIAGCAIARAGMVAVPVDPTAPAARALGIIAEVDAAFVLTDISEQLATGVPILNLRDNGDEVSHSPDFPDVPVQENALVSISFTSGSTGTPKGVMMPAAARRLIPYLLALAPDIEFNRVGMPGVGSAGGAVTSAHNLFGLGLTLVFYDIRKHGLALLEQWLLETRVMVFAAVPTVFRYFIESVADGHMFPDLHWIVSSGEPLPWELVAKIRPHLNADAAVVNLFGLTETLGFAGNIVSSGEPIGTGMVPAGTPLSFAHVEILDEEGQPVPSGEPGEIVVTSTLCALGYWNEEGLTSERFENLGEAGRRIATGDLGRLRIDGVLEHIGRIDQQVKISGNRVEPGEVEHALLSISGVHSAAVVPFSDGSGNTRLAAFVVSARHTRTSPPPPTYGVGPPPASHHDP